jgi:hypothetical protein
MGSKKLKIAQKFAPILCCELSKNRRKRIYDCFSAIDFHPDKKPCEMEDFFKGIFKKKNLYFLQ